MNLRVRFFLFCWVFLWGALQNVTAEVYQAESCQIPGSLLFTDFGKTSVRVQWGAVEGALSYELAVVPFGGQIDESQLIAAQENAHTVSDLQSGTSYEVFVRARCSPATVSDWSVSERFVTIPSCGQYFYDQGGADDYYPRGVEQLYVLRPDREGQFVSLKFTEFDMFRSEFRVYNGDVKNELEFLGDSGGRGNNHETYYSTHPSGALTVYFKSDDRYSRSGWKALLSCGSCPLPRDVLVAGRSMSSLSFSWEGADDAKWEIALAESKGKAPESGLVVSKSFHTFENLSQGVYDFYIRPVCGDESVGEWYRVQNNLTALSCQTSTINFKYDYHSNNQFDQYRKDTVRIYPGRSGGFAGVTLRRFYNARKVKLKVYDGDGTEKVLTDNAKAGQSFYSSSSDGVLTLLFEKNGNQSSAEVELGIECQSGAVPSDFRVTSETSSSIALDWGDVEERAFWVLELKPVFDQNGPIVNGKAIRGVASGSSAYTYDRLPSGTYYEIRIQALYPDESVSKWVTVQAMTLPGCGEKWVSNTYDRRQYIVDSPKQFTVYPETEGGTVVFNLTDFANYESDNYFLSVYNGSDLSDPIAEKVSKATSFTSTSENGALTIRYLAPKLSTAKYIWKGNFECFSCASPKELEVYEISNSQAKARWNGESVQQGQWEYALAEDDKKLPEEGTAVSSNQLVLNDLVPGKQYFLYVRTKCDQIMPWLKPVSFRTKLYCGDKFYDNGGKEKNYSPNTREIFTVYPKTEGSIVNVEFSSVELHEDDRLTVYDGTGTDKVLVYRPEQGQVVSAQDASGALTFEFVSDYRNEMAGWEAQIGCAQVYAPHHLKAEIAGGKEVHLSWEAQEGVAWDVRIRKKGSESFIVQEKVNEKAYIFTGFESNADYEYRVRTRGEADNLSVWSQKLEFTGPFSSAGKLYVNASADASGNGSSWAEAFKSLQEALDAAREGTEIWMAQGTYYPSKMFTPDGTDERNRAFRLLSGQKIYGGFNGTENSLEQRDWERHPTVLSADYLKTTTTDNDNAVHLLLVEDQKDWVVVDGLQVTGGYADFSDESSKGGGMCIVNSRVSMSNMSFANNFADDGGALYVKKSSITMDNVLLQENVSDNAGGGACFEKNVEAVLKNVVFRKNKADDYGGGLYCEDNVRTVQQDVRYIENFGGDYGGGFHDEGENGFHRMTKMVFEKNTTEGYGGAVFTYEGCRLDVDQSVFKNNDAEYGGAVYHSSNSNINVANALFAGNVAEEGGGAFYSDGRDGCRVKLINATLVKNFAEYGNVLSLEGNIQLSLANSILFQNLRKDKGEIFDISDENKVQIKNSLFEGDLKQKGIKDLGGNISSDPVFVNSQRGDYRLAACSPAIDKGDNSAAARYGKDLSGRARKVDERVDMGAYENPFLEAFPDLQLEAEQNFCENREYTLRDISLSVESGGVLHWFADETSVEELPVETALTHGSTYYVSSSDGSVKCGKSERKSVRISLLQPPAINTCIENVTFVIVGESHVLDDYTSLLQLEPNSCDVQVSQVPAAGTKLNLGANTVKLTANNAAGSASCTFKVTVALPSPPVVNSCVENKTFVIAEEAHVLGDYTSALVLASSPYDAQVSQVPASGTQLGIGVHTVKLTASNAGGSTNCTFQVTVNRLLHAGKEEKISIFPNPVSDRLKFRSSERITKIEIFDLQGRLIFEKNNTDDFVDVSGLGGGVYFVRLNTEHAFEIHRFRVE